MGWISSIVIGVLSAVLGCVGAGFVATKCVRWYRISSFEGGSGYYVVGIALLGIVVGLVLGIVCARVVAGMPGPSFFKGIGVAFGSMTGLVVLAGVLARLAADVPPERAGKSLELAVEVRCPPGFTVPAVDEKYGAFASVHLPRGGSQPQGELRLKEMIQVDGRWIVPATVPLETSASRKYLRAYFNQQNDLMFDLRLAGQPKEKDCRWSQWVESGWNVGQPEPAPEQKFQMRFRVQEILPPPPGPTQAEVDAKNAAEEKARFEAIPATAPITDWLPYTQYGPREDWRTVAIGHMTARENFSAELAQLMIDNDPAVAAEALRLVEHLPQPTPALHDGVAEAGRRIAAFIREKNSTTVEADPGFAWAAEASKRFSAWMVAVRTLREKSGGDFTGPLREILELSRVREDSHSMRADIRRVASFYMHEWTGLAPAPGDPKPR
jgi:hypothetical protein